MNTFKKQIDAWMEQEDLVSARIVLGGFHKPGELARRYRKLFPPHDPEAALLVAAPLKSLSNARVLERLNTVFEKRPDVVRALLEAWLEDNGPTLKRLAAGAWPFEEGLPPAPWWEAAGRLLQAQGVQPEWSWFGQVATPKLPAAKPVGSPKTDDRRLKTCKKNLKDCQEKAQAIKQDLAECASNLEEKEALFQKRLREKEAELVRARSEAEEYLLKLEATQRRLDAVQKARDGLKAEKDDLRVRLADQERELTRVMSALEECQQPPDATPEPGPQPVNLPFDPENFANVWIIPYAELAADPRVRLLALIGLYRAALEGRDHVLLKKTSWPGPAGKPHGIMLLDTDRLLHDLVLLPINRWLRSSLFSTEACLLYLDRKIETALLEDS